MDLMNQISNLQPFEVHKQIVAQYIFPIINHKNDEAKSGKGQLGYRDQKVIYDHNRFLWDKEPETWEEKFAKRYYDKLFKEYAICDLSRFKENKIALRWRVEKEVLSGKGQFICGSKKCDDTDTLRTWEVNFAYKEAGEAKNALVKLRLCPSCSKKLNYRTQKREIKRLKKKKSKRSKLSTSEQASTSHSNSLGENTKSETLDSTSHSFNNNEIESNEKESAESIWTKPIQVEKSRDEQFESYLEELLL